MAGLWAAAVFLLDVLALWDQPAVQETFSC